MSFLVVLAFPSTGWLSALRLHPLSFPTSLMFSSEVVMYSRKRATIAMHVRHSHCRYASHSQGTLLFSKVWIEHDSSNLRTALRPWYLFYRYVWYNNTTRYDLTENRTVNEEMGFKTHGIESSNAKQDCWADGKSFFLPGLYPGCAVPSPSQQQTTFGKGNLQYSHTCQSPSTAKSGLRARFRLIMQLRSPIDTILDDSFV